MSRLFLAVEPPLKVKKEIAQESSRLKNKIPNWQVSWVNSQNLHITLIFFGEVNKRQEEKIKQEVSNTARKIKKFSVQVKKLSAKETPLWLEVDRGKTELVNLQREIRKNLPFKGATKYSFHPHLTLGRVKNQGKSIIQNEIDGFFWEVKELVLYQSKPQKEGSVYLKRATFPLKG